MEVTRISLEHTGRFNRLILDYIKGDEKLKDFYSLAHTVENYRKQIEKRAQFPVDRELLADSLLNQYRSIGGANGSVLTNIESLRKNNAFTVTTGHQLNIFTGPLYFIYKILHTIKLVDELSKSYPDNQFVPIYWMNSEDHDLEEVGQFNLFGKKHIWQTDQTGATGKMNPASLVEFCSELEETLSNDAEGLKLVSLFKKAYSEHADLATATRFFSNELFGKYGLVIIDSNDAALKKPFVEIMKRDILQNEPFELVRKTNQMLESAGYHAQVNPRQINLFYLADGVRNRIVATEKGFKVFQTDIRFTEAQLLDELVDHPERFSPNVVLRPLFQEFILPNLTYVGGAGELSYWLQYKDYFQAFNACFPMLSLRNHFLLIDSANSKKMEELKLLPEDLFHAVDDLIRGHVMEVADADISLDKEGELLRQLYESLKSRADQIDSSLVASVEAEETRVAKNLEQWGSRFSRALKKDNEVSVNRIRKIHRKLFPNGFLQERHDNFMEHYSKMGSSFMEDLLEITAPFQTQFTVIQAVENKA